MTSSLLVGLAAFLIMEPVTYLAHRFVMHGPGRRLHQSHHRPTPSRFEGNDLFPVVFAAVTVLGMAAAYSAPGLHPLLEVTWGVSAYGLAYLFVHDVYTHARLGRLPVIAPLEHLKQAHGLHHRFGGEPYGMLLPIIPATLRRRALRPSSATGVLPARR